MGTRRVLRPSEGAKTAGAVSEGIRGGSGGFSVALPYPPSVNHLYRLFRGRVVKSAEGHAYDLAVKVHILRALNVTSFDLEPPYKLSIQLHPPDARRSDADNRVKALQDAVWKALDRDDVTVSEVHVYRKAPDREKPRADVLIEEAANG